MAAKKKEEKCDLDPDDGSKSKSVLEALLKDSSEDHFAFVDKDPKIVSTGSLVLDSLVKVRSGEIIRLCAKGAELGKTSQAFVFARNFMDTFPKSKTILIKAEARLSPEIQKRSGHTFALKTEDWEYGTVFVFPCNIFETIAKTLESLIKEMVKMGEQLFIIWDSLDATILRNDMSKEVWDGKESPKVAGVPLMTKLLFRRFALPLEYANSMMAVICQYATEIKLDPYSKEPPRQNPASGGSSINHMSSYTFSYFPRYGKDLILENPNESPDPVKNKTLGVYATIEITKSGTDVSGTKVRIPIKKGVIGCAIWTSKEVVDLCLMYELISRKGSWYSFSSEIRSKAEQDGISLQESFQGLPAVYQFFEDNKATLDWFVSLLKNLFLS